MKTYQEFLQSKQATHASSGVVIPESELNSKLFPFQRRIISWALEQGKSAIFADCGLGKTFMQLEWAKHLPVDKVLILAPLAVSQQTKREGSKFGISVNICDSNDDIMPGINITNYEKLHKFDCSQFDAVVLDESSILKNYTGKYRNLIIESFNNTPYKLACTATPAPNDYMELGNHAEFLSVKSRTEMLAEYFVHDGGETQKWRLKRHAVKSFWQWVSTWACVVRTPSDIGFCDDGFSLPKLEIHEEIVNANYQEQGFLFPMVASTLSERQTARKKTITERAKAAAQLINQSPEESWIVWCNLNDESKAIYNLIPGAVEVKGSDSSKHKSESMLRFSDGEIQVLITKPSICGFGMNWQHCSNVIFLGLSDSYEEFYQAVRRCWRFGQKNQVNAYIVISDTEGAVIKNIKRKENQTLKMAEMMTKEIDAEWQHNTVS